FHPHATAAGAAAKGIFAIAPHLAEFDWLRHCRTQCGSQNFARRLVHAVHPRQVAGIVIGHWRVCSFLSPRRRSGERIKVRGRSNWSRQTLLLTLTLSSIRWRRGNTIGYHLAAALCPSAFEFQFPLRQQLLN